MDAVRAVLLIDHGSRRDEANRTLERQLAPPHSNGHDVPMRAVLLVDHGSKRAEANQALERLAIEVEAILAASGSVARVFAAHMELAEPSIPMAIGAVVAAGATELVVQPCMLSRGRHFEEDVPQLIRETLGSSSEVRVVLGPPLSELRGFADFLARSALGLHSRSR